MKHRPLTTKDVRLDQDGTLVAAPAWAFEVVERIGYRVHVPVHQLWVDVTPEIDRRRAAHEAEQAAQSSYHKKTATDPQAHWTQRSASELWLKTARSQPAAVKRLINFKTVKLCRVCSQDFYGTGGVVTCSERCALVRRNATRTRAAAPRPHVVHQPRTCDYCGQKFEPTRSDAQFCSVRCRVASHRLKIS
jgi:hypothetical protein